VPTWITKDNFCDPEALADSAEIDSIQKTENVTEMEKTSQAAFPLGQKTMLPPDLESEYGRKYRYRLHIQPTDQAWTDVSSILIEIETKNGYQDSVRLDEMGGFHTFKIPPHQEKRDSNSFAPGEDIVRKTKVFLIIMTLQDSLSCVLDNSELTEVDDKLYGVIHSSTSHYLYNPFETISEDPLI